MALVDDIRSALRVTSERFDPEIQTLIDSALYDMGRVGVNPDLLSGNVENAFVRQAVTAYCKAHFGYDNPEADRFDDAYRRIVCDLMNSSENVAAMEPEPEGEGQAEVPEPETDGEGE